MQFLREDLGLAGDSTSEAIIADDDDDLEILEEPNAVQSPAHVSQKRRAAVDDAEEQEGGMPRKRAKHSNDVVELE